MKKPIIVIAGPTGSGKTSLGIKLAKRFNGMIINGDSVAIYKGMDIGTAKPIFDSIKNNFKLVDGVPHFLFDIKNPNEDFNAATYVNEVKRAIKNIQKPVFIVGGSMLYIDAFVYDYDFTKKGRPKLKLPKNVLYLAIDVPREKIYQSINQRFDEMIRSGLLSEVKNLHQKYGNIKALNSAGYKELIQYLNKKLTLDEAIEKAKQSHRNYAKRQLTWFRRNKDIAWIKNEKQAEKKIENFLKS